MLQAALVAFIGGVALFKSAQYLPRLTAFSCLFLFLFLFHRKKPLLVLVLIAGALFCFVRDRPVRPLFPPGFNRGGGFESLFGYASPAVRLRRGFYQPFHVTGSADPERPFPREEIRLYTPKRQKPLEAGRLYEIQAMVRPPAPRLDPGFPNSTLKPEARILGASAIGAAPFAERMRDRLNGYYMRNFPPEEAGLLMAITTGDRMLLGDRMRRDFNNCGLAHLISIAGLHFGMFSLSIFLMVWAVLRFLVPLKALEKLTLHISPKQAAAIVALPLLLGYLMLSGMRIPALRAFIMISFFLAGLLAGRRRAWLATLLFAAFVLVVWRPDVLLDISFEMSFVSVLIIGYLSENFLPSETASPGEAKKEKRPAAAIAVLSVIRRYLARVFILSLLLAAGLMPLIAFYFNRIQWISPVANLAAVPVSGFLLIPVAVLSGFFYLATGVYPLAALSGRLALITAGLARFFSSIPYSSVPVPAFPAGLLFIFYGFAALCALRKDMRYLALAVAPFIIWAGIRHLTAPDLHITFLDCGRGESAVVNLPDGKTAVVDAGSSGREAASLLRTEGKSSIDFLILPHAPLKGAGCANYLAARFRIGQVWDNGLLVLPDGFEAAEKRLSRGDCFEGNGYRFLVLHPYRGFYPGGPVSQAVNNTSLVFKVEDCNGRSALFTSDIERPAQRDLLYLGGYLRSDVYEVPREGGPAAAWQPFIQAVRPEVAVIMPEVEKSFHTPGARTLRALSSCGAKILRTDKDGAVRVDFRKNGIRVRTFVQSALVKNPRGLGAEFHNLRMLLSAR